jgi:hypothetical protein
MIILKRRNVVAVIEAMLPLDSCGWKITQSRVKD